MTSLLSRQGLPFLQINHLVSLGKVTFQYVPMFQKIYTETKGEDMLSTQRKSRESGI